LLKKYINNSYLHYNLTNIDTKMKGLELFNDTYRYKSGKCAIQMNRPRIRGFSEIRGMNRVNRPRIRGFSEIRGMNRVNRPRIRGFSEIRGMNRVNRQRSHMSRLSACPQSQ